MPEVYDPKKHGAIIPNTPEEYDPAIHGQISPLENEVMGHLPTGPMDGPKGQEVMQLPAPGPDMYKGMNPQQQNEVFTRYKQHPDSQTGFLAPMIGGTTYQDQEVPLPAAAEEYNPYTDFSDFTDFPGVKSVAGGIVNTPKEILTTGTAAGEWLDENLVDPDNTGTKIIPRGSAAWLDQTIPEYETDGPVDAFITESAQAGVGGTIGLKAVAAGLKNLPRAIRWAAKALAIEGGAATTIDQDTPGLLVGESQPDDVIPKFWGGLALDENGQYNEELLKKRINIFADLAITAKIGEKAVRGAGHVGKFIYDVIGTPMDVFLRKSPKEQAIVREMADTLQGWHENLTPEEQYHWRIKMADGIEKHSVIKGETGVEGIDNVDMRRDTMTSYERSLPEPPKGDKQAYRDSIAQRAKINSLRTGQKGKGSPALEAATGQAARELRDLNLQTDIVFGGDEGIKASKEAIQESGFKQVDAYKDAVDTVDTKLTDAKKGADSLVENDETFGKLPREGEVKLNVDEQTQSSLDKAVDEADIESTTRTNQKNLLFKAIPEDAHVNTASLNEAIETASPALDDTLRAKLGAAGDNFKKLDEFASFDLQDAIGKAVKDGEFGKARLLRGLKKNINEDQMDYLVTSGDAQTRDAAQRAKEYYKNEYAPYFREGVGEEIQDISREKKVLKPGEYRRDTRAAVMRTVDDPNAKELTGKFYDLLEKKGNGKLLADYAFGKMAGKAQKIVNKNGRLTREEIDALGAELDNFAPIFEKAGQTKRLEDFRTKLRDKNQSVAELTKNLDDMKKLAKEVEDQILGEELKDLFKREGTGYIAKDDGYTIFNKIMDDPERIGELENLARRSRDPDTPLASDGMKAAFGRWSREKFFKAGQDAGGAPLVNEQVYGKDFKHMMRVGQAILGNEHSPLLHVQEMLMKEAGEMSLSETQRAFRLGDVGAQDKGMRDSVATVITFAFGTLDRMGARVRAASGRAITKMSKSEQAREIMDIMYANPDEFVRVLRDVAKRDRPKLSKEDKDILFSMGFKGAVAADWFDEEDGNSKLDKSSRKSFEQTKRVLGEQ